MQLWETLTVFQRVLLIMALPFSVLMGIHFMLSLFGRSNFFEYSDIVPDAADNGQDLDRGVRAPGRFTGLLRAVSAFFAVGSWTALALTMYTKSLWAALGGIAAGGLAVGVVVLMIRLAEKIKVYGKISPELALGHSAEVTIHVPPRRLAPGQVTLEINGRSYDVDAVSDGDVFITLGTKVKIVGVSGEWVVVEPEKE